MFAYRLTNTLNYDIHLDLLLITKTQHLLYEVDIIEEEFDAKEKVERHVRSSFFRFLFPPLWGHLG